MHVLISKVYGGSNKEESTAVYKREEEVEFLRSSHHTHHLRSTYR